MAMLHVEVREMRGQFAPELVHAEVVVNFHRVVEKNDGTFGQFGAPGFVVMFDGVVEVQAVDVKEVYRGVRDIRQGLIKGHAQECREGFVPAVVCEKVAVDGLLVMGGVGVAEPRVDGIAAGGELQFLDGLAEGAVGDAVLGAEFDEDARLEELREEHGEGRVLDPSGFSVQALGKEGEQRVVEGVEYRQHGDSLHGGNAGSENRKSNRRLFALRVRACARPLCSWDELEAGYQC